MQDDSDKLKCCLRIAFAPLMHRLYTTFLHLTHPETVVTALPDRLLSPPASEIAMDSPSPG